MAQIGWHRPSARGGAGPAPPAAFGGPDGRTLFVLAADWRMQDGFEDNIERLLILASGDPSQVVTADVPAFALVVGVPARRVGAHDDHVAAQAAGLFAEEIVPVHVPQKKGDAIVFSADFSPIRSSATTSASCSRRSRPGPWRREREAPTS